MKQLIFLSTFIFVLINVQTQDYQCVTNSTEQFFTNGEYYLALKIDSTQVFPNHTSHYNFFVIGSTEPYSYCLNPEHPSWIGSRIDIYENGDHYFFNVSGDSILVKTNAAVDDWWICYSFDTEDYVRGKVMWVEEMEFLGQVDSVKTIQFNAFSLSGNPIPNPVNGLKLKVSKSFGMVQALNFKVFPDLVDYPYYDEIEEYDLCGTKEPENGVQNLTIEDIFDFELEDELHTEEHYTSFWENNHFYYEILKVLDKDWLNDSSVSYSFERCKKFVFETPNWDSSYSIHDTTNILVDFWQYEDPGLNEMPDKNLMAYSAWEYDCYWYEQTLNSEHGVRSKSYRGGFFYEEEEDCVLEIMDYYHEAIYLDGLGGPYWDYEDMAMGDNYKGLVYYKKGEEEWGIPYYCDSLMVSVENRTDFLGRIRINPNPMTDRATVTLRNQEQSGFQVQLFDPTGNLVRSYQTSKSSLILNRDGLPPGLYLLVISDQANNYMTRKLIIR